MKRQKNTAKSRRKKQVPPHENAVAADKKKSRREFLTTLKNTGLIVTVSGGIGWFFVSDVCAATREADLERIGNGIPAVVQIHDPQCPSCIALQRETREAMSNFDEGELQYLVANIKSDKGRELANKHQVRHVTLLLFDGKGNRQRTLTGPNSSGYLKSVFKSHLARSSRK